MHADVHGTSKSYFLIHWFGLHRIKVVGDNWHPLSAFWISLDKSNCVYHWLVIMRRKIFNDKAAAGR